VHYKDNGDIEYVNSGFKQTGKWTIEGTNVCAKWIQAGTTNSCNEFGIADNQLYLRRQSGVVVRMMRVE